MASTSGKGKERRSSASIYSGRRAPERPGVEGMVTATTMARYAGALKTEGEATTA